MTGTEEKKLEEMTTEQLLAPYFRIAKLSLMLMAKLLPDGVKLTLVARWPEENHPVVFGDDDLKEVEKVLHEVNGDYRGELFNTEYVGNFSMPPNGKPH